MRGHRATAPRPPRVRARSAAIGAFVVLAATVPAAASAAGTQEVDAELPYVCALPSGRQPVTVRVSATFPDRAEPGGAFSPADVTTTVELPAEAVADLTASDAATVRAATRLTVGVAQGEAAAEATWRGTAEPVPLPGSGPLALTTTGDVPSVTGQGEGDLTFSAGNLAVDLEPGTADGTAAGPGAPTLDCSPAGDTPENGLLATVPVGTDTPEPSGSPSAPGSSPAAPDPSSGTPGDGEGDGRGDRAPGVAENPPGTAAGRDAPPCRYDDGNPSTSASLNAYITGYSNVRKLRGASLIPLSCVLVEQGPLDIVDFFPDFSGAYLKQHSEGRLHHQGRARTPPFQADFLSFGFVPTRATMVLEQTGPLTLDVAGETVFETGYTTFETRARVPLVLRVTALEVNGTPLDVGAGCRTKSPLRSPEPDPSAYPGDHMVLFGSSTHQPPEMPVGYLLSSGGPLTGEVTVPAFTGCGTGGENLDRLLTASVSGPGNYVKQIQGQTCAVQVFNPDECTEDLQPLKIPVPER
ncbi:DUF6801 domain-containing protein [Streptomyces sp. NPDC000348]|uniref:DUF6801 domain-containing protein n=1 Tax=Streptomyces sp. NPDC000348 TaxID=3364538 RepID=UPI0036A5F716